MAYSLIIGSRASKLALTQSRWVASQLSRFHPDLAVEIVEVRTSGDRNLAASLTELGGKGAFTKELEDALLDRRCDIAVHSLKDLPTFLPDGLRIACTPAREDFRDVLILRRGTPGDDPLAAIAQGAPVGTSSLRRRAQLLRARPDLKVIEFRGNVDTRLRKLADGEAHACILAAAGLKRLALLNEEEMMVEDFHAVWLEPPDWLPAVGQGALGIEARADDAATAQLLAPLHDAATFGATAAERAFLNELGAGCQAPVGAFAVAPEGSSLHLTGCVLSVDGKQLVSGGRLGDLAHAVTCGRELARELKSRGAARLL
jgi:hydroxymethylbilane synthase